MKPSRRPQTSDRRAFLRGAGLGVGAGSFLLAANGLGDEPAREGRLKIAAILTEFSHRSHAHVILENFLDPYLFNSRRGRSSGGRSRSMAGRR